MRRADRLFHIVQQLRARRLTTASQLAGRLEISLRTVYRDIRDLSLSGIPIRGEAGVGYSLAPEFNLTPLMFTPEEVEATRIFARGINFDPGVGSRLEQLRQAISAKSRISVGYEDRDSRATQRALRPLGLYFWGASWTLLAWCETRDDFRSFRIDRI